MGDEFLTKVGLEVIMVATKYPRNKIIHDRTETYALQFVGSSLHGSGGLF